jgi:hypothetical protein
VGPPCRCRASFVAATLVALHAPVYTGHVAVPCRLKAWDFRSPIGDTKRPL